VLTTEEVENAASAAAENNKAVFFAAKFPAI
jgi:hypothetical protein